MTIRTITGTVEYADGAIPQNSRLEFYLNGIHIDAVTIAHSAVYTPLDETGDIVVDLYPNDTGYGADRYNVDLVTYSDSEYIKEIRRVNLGKIYVEDVDGQILQDLLALFSGPSEPLTVAQEASADAIAAANAAAASAANAALYDGVWLDTVAALTADTTLSYTAGPGLTVVADGDYVRTRADGFSYQVAAAGASDHHLVTAGGVRLAVLAGADGYSVLAFGAIGDGATDCTAAIAMVRSVAAARAFAGNTTSIVWPAGRYVYSASPNWAITGLEMSFHGEVWLILSGAGNAFVVDGGASGAGVYGLRIVGSPRIYGGPLSTFGVYARAILNSRIEINVRGAGVRGVYAEWLVDNELDITMSGNEGGLYNEPSDALVAMSVRGAGEDCSYNRVTLRIGGPVDGATPHAGRGLYLDGALGNTFSGTVQNCDLGAQLTANAWENKFVGMDFEGNTADVEDGARRSLWLGCDMEQGITVSSTATGCEIRSGRVENITIASGAIGAVLATRYNRTGAGTITDAGTKTYYDPAIYNIVTQTFGKPKSATVLTVATPSHAYTNSSANSVQVSVYGGTVSGVILSHAGGYYTGATQGLFVVPPSSTITVESTVAPQMVVFA